MKKMTKFFALALLAGAMVSCSTEDTAPSTQNDKVAVQFTFSRESLLKQNDAASQEVTHSAVAVYGMIIAYRAKKGNRQN